MSNSQITYQTMKSVVIMCLIWCATLRQINASWTGSLNFWVWKGREFVKQMIGICESYKNEGLKIFGDELWSHLGR